MKKINIVRKNEEFNNIINIGNKKYSKHFYLYLLKNDCSFNRYGIAISKKIGNAVVRNKYKRQIKGIIDGIILKTGGYDIILIAKTSIKNVEYIDIKEDLFKLLNNIGE